MVTAEDDRELLYEALNQGANDFLKKPVDELELVARTRRYTQRFSFALLDADHFKQINDT